MPIAVPSSLKRALRVLGIFFAGQFATQALNGITGLMIVRLLPKTEYAWLTIANAMTASFSVMLDPVIGVGLQSLAAPARNDPSRLTSILRQAMRWQWKWTGLMALGIFPLTAFLLIKSGATGIQCGMMLTATSIAIPAITSAMIHGTVPKIHGRLRELQVVDVTSSASRLAITSSTLIPAPFAALAALASSACQWVQASLLHRAAKPSLANVVPPEANETARALSAQMWRMLPHTIFLCIQGHIGIWILGCFGSASSLADLGALMRLGILLAWAGGFSQQVLIPALNRRESSTELKHLALVILTLGIGGGALLAAISWCFPQPFLWLLGPAYGHLHTELGLTMIFFSLSTLSTVNWWFNASRGWVQWAVWVPPCSVAAYGITLCAITPSTASSALATLISGQIVSLSLGIIQSSDGLTHEKDKRHID